MSHKHIRGKYDHAQDEQTHVRGKYFYFCPVLSTDITWIHLENQIPISNIGDWSRPQLSTQPSENYHIGLLGCQAIKIRAS